jgi:hypothetical protein
LITEIVWLAGQAHDRLDENQQCDRHDDPTDHVEVGGWAVEHEYGCVDADGN